jgi:hypothetical protein
MSDTRDIQHGVNDPVSGVDVRWKFLDNRTPHERAQSAADVRAWATPDPAEGFLPEALRRPPTPPLNKRTGRNRSE